MKFFGHKMDEPNEEICVIPRTINGEQVDIVFKAKAVLDYTDFEKMCPVPNPPEMILPGGERKLDIQDKDYRKRLNEYAQKKTAWMFIKSLEDTEGLEWETVDAGNPETWLEYNKELKSGGFSDMEILKIYQTVTSACGLNQDKIDEAQKRFLAGQGRTLASVYFQSSEQLSTPFGEDVKDSE